MGKVWFLGLGANTWRAREREPITRVWGGAPSGVLQCRDRSPGWGPERRSPL